MNSMKDEIIMSMKRLNDQIDRIDKKIDSVERSMDFIYTKTNQKSQEWFPHGKDEEMRFDYVNIDKDGSFFIAYTIRKKNAGEKCND